jgi:hypothetical protein
VTPVPTLTPVPAATPTRAPVSLEDTVRAAGALLPELPPDELVSTDTPEFFIDLGVAPADIGLTYVYYYNQGAYVEGSGVNLVHILLYN